jgi:hypothetical protein
MTPRFKLIAFAGPAGAGKSTAADALVEIGFKRVKFAAILKDMLRALYRGTGLDELEIERRIEGDLKEQRDPLLGGRSPRHAMITLGTEWGRDLIHPELWVRTWQARVRLELERGNPVVCDDLRFPNECAAVRELGGRVVKIEGRSLGIAAHPSEAQAFEANFTIRNHGTELEFKGRVQYHFGVSDHE